MNIAQDQYSNRMVNDIPVVGACMKSVLIVLSLLPFAISAQVVSQSVPHQHGTGHVSIIADGSELVLSLKVPSADIVGFERNAETDDERALIASAVSDLSDPLNLFVFPTDAGCAALSANVALVGDAFGQDTQDGSETHTEFHADYRLQCQNIMKVDRIEFAYFDRFPKTQILRVEMDVGNGERTQAVKPQQPTLDVFGSI